MPNKKEDLIQKLTTKPTPRNFSMRELDFLMKRCGCLKKQGGRGSSVAYVHAETKRILQFDQPHPGTELYTYQVKMVIAFLQGIGQIDSSCIRE